MKILRVLALALVLGLAGFVSGCASTDPVPGRDYAQLDSAQPVPGGAQIVVVEFFWYGCPHCFSLEPGLRDWVKKLPADVAFRKVHVALGPAWEPHQQLFYTLEALGKNALDEKVFTALHVERITLDKPDRMADFLAKHGVDRKAFLDTYDSFAVRTRKQKATQQARAWGLDGVPGLAVNGKYFTAPSMAKGNAQSLQVVEYLLDLERKARK